MPLPRPTRQSQSQTTIDADSYESPIQCDMIHYIQSSRHIQSVKTPTKKAKPNRHFLQYRAVVLSSTAHSNSSKEPATSS